MPSASPPSKQSNNVSAACASSDSPNPGILREDKIMKVMTVMTGYDNGDEDDNVGENDSGDDNDKSTVMRIILEMIMIGSGLVLL